MHCGTYWALSQGTCQSTFLSPRNLRHHPVYNFMETFVQIKLQYCNHLHNLQLTQKHRMFNLEQTLEIIHSSDFFFSVQIDKRDKSRTAWSDPPASHVLSSSQSPFSPNNLGGRGDRGAFGRELCETPGISKLQFENLNHSSYSEKKKKKTTHIYWRFLLQKESTVAWKLWNFKKRREVTINE